MAFPPTQQCGHDWQVSGTEDAYAGESMQWIPGLNHSPSDNLSMSPHNGDTRRVNPLFWQQDPPFPSILPCFNTPQTLVTQTAPPFRASQSHVSDHRQYHTDSQANGLQTSFISGLGSVPGEVRASQDTVNPEFLTKNDQNVSYGETSGFQDFLPAAVKTPNTFGPQPTMKSQ
jgi:hypothetical protein